MPKRKRTTEETVEQQLAKFQQDLHHALKLAKGFERQRQAKRLKDTKATAEKKERIQKEIVVLKSLDLQQAAHAHLCASLLKIKSVAAAPDLPAELRAGPPKLPDITDEERSLLHNVTSALYNRKEPKAVLAKAIPAICGTLGVEVPPKKGKGAGKDDRKEKAEQSADRDIGATAKEEVRGERKDKKRVKETALAAPEDLPDEEVEREIAKYEALLGGSDEEDSDSDGDEEEDPMQITSDEGEEDDGFGDIDLESEDDKSSFDGFSSDDGEPADGKAGAKLQDRESSEDEGSEADSDAGAKLAPPSSDDSDDSGSDSDDSAAISRSPSPKRSSKRRKAEDPGPTTGSTFLPSLMGGYISGSESEASDLDIAPPRKNRRGQRARQAIWEKKFKEEAKHLHKQKRDQGWDAKRGAVEGGNSRTPWKRGISNPFSKTSSDGAGGGKTDEPPKKPRVADNQGPLHPSWEAKKRAEEKLQNVKFEGKKITFD